MLEGLLANSEVCVRVHQSRIESQLVRLECATHAVEGLRLENFARNKPRTEQALTLLHKTQALNAITGDYMSIADVAKFRSIVNTATKSTEPGRFIHGPT